jgi:hypothetical protein
MKRDWELVRLILRKIQEEENSEIEGNDDARVREHQRLLKEAGLIDGVPDGSGFMPWDTCRLTWQGHDLIETSLSEAVSGYPIMYRPAV